MNVPADILLFAIVAAGLIFWLRNVLGTRHGDERDRSGLFLGDPVNGQKNKTQSDGFSLFSKDPENAFTGEEGTPLEQGLAVIARADRSFDPDDFIEGAKEAFAMIVEAFAAGDRDTLKSLLSEPVYETFDKVIDERKERGETVSTEIHAVRKADILDARLVDRMAFLTVRFTADETCVIKDSEQNTISGDPDRITEMVDVWVFGRDVRSRDPSWYLFETRDDEIEEHKTPLPEHKKD